MLKYLAVLLIPFCLASCAGSNKEKSDKDPVVPNGIQDQEKTATSFFPAGVDSFEVVYYKKPFTDSARYYRFFRVAMSSDSTVIKEINEVFAGTYEKLPEVKKCLSEGKLIIPLGGDAYKTIYFSRLETGCPYLYYIKDGAFYYFELSPVLNNKLNDLEKIAVEPN
jgi:hypothetical protein